MIVHQVVGGAGPVDAVTNQARAWRARFAAWGWGGEDFAEVFSPDMTRGVMKPLTAYEPRPGELTLLHFSGYVPKLEQRLAPPYAVLSHNVTPPRYFWELEPGEAVRCALAPQQLVALAAGAELAAGVSAFNAADLGVQDPAVIPILFDRDRLPAPALEAPDGPPTILFVGRLAPHKRQDLVVRAFARYRALRAPDARLVLVGVPISPDFDARLRRLADDLAPGAVRFASAISSAELHDQYRSAHAFLCLSEHEGFCIPLLEAMHFGVPIVARAVGGIGEVIGDAGMLLGEDDDLAVVAELLHLAVTEPGLRATLRPRAQARLAHFAANRVAEQMRARLEAMAALMADLRSLAVRRLSRLGPDRLRALGPRSAGTFTIPVGLAQGLRLNGIPLAHAHLGVMAYGILEPPVQEALRRHLGPGGVLYDVGANVGFFTLLGARLAGDAGHVYAIEPAPDNAAAIRANVALNGLGAGVTVLEQAAGAQAGAGRLQVVGDQSWSKLAETGAHPGTDSVVDVRVIALDDLDLRPPTVVKIDVEGHELAVLEGMRRTLATHAPAVVCELHDTAAEFVAFMHDAGYRVVNLESPGPIEAEPSPAHALALALSWESPPR